MNCKNFVDFVKYYDAFNWTHLNRPDWIMSFQQQGDEFIENIERGINASKIFEISNDLKKLLILTKTPRDNEEVKLPFPVMFLDVDFTKEELEELNIKIDANKIIGILAQRGVMLDNGGNVVGSDLNICMLSIQANEEVWFDTFNKNVNIEDKELEGSKVKVLENDTTDKKARDFVHKFFLNFINFVNSPDVSYVEQKRSEKNIQRKRKEGKVAIPSSFKIYLSGQVREYIDKITSGGNFHFNYRFWVRGHFRNLNSQRYSEKKRIWIMPYIKGDGVLINKSYKLNKKEKNNGK